METKVAPQLYRREQVAEKLGISLRAADELILTKQLPSLKIGKRRPVIRNRASSIHPEA